MDSDNKKDILDSRYQTNEIIDNTIGQESDSDQIVIRYTRPKFFHRVLANFLDFIILTLLFFACFLLTRKIFNSTPTYSNAFNTINNMRIDSGLYVKESGRFIDIVSYMKSDSSYNDNAVVIKSEKVVAQFYTFEEPLVSAERFNKMKSTYDELRLNKTNSEGQHLFILQDGEIIKDPELYQKKKAPYASFYYSYLDKYLQGYLSTTPKYYDATKVMSNFLLWVEIPTALVLGILLTYFLPSIIFVRGRCTFGKALYRIGTVDSRYLNPSFGRNLAKWGIFLLEFVAGIASLGVIFILSTTMMAFSKKRQGFPDFMLGLQEIDMRKDKIYKSLEEIKLEPVTTNKKPNDFRLINRP